MKRTGYLFLLLAFTFTCTAGDADAQFFKKLFGKKDHKRSSNVQKPKPKTKPAVKEKPSIVKKKQEDEYPPTVKKSRYRIDVFVPLYLDELIKDNKPTFKGKLPEKAINGIDFYEGVKLASDTLNSLGYNIDLYVHDITHPTEAPDALMKRNALDSTDLIIGAVSNLHIPALASFAKKHNINFISAYSPSDAGVKNNPFFIQIQPSLESHCKWLSAAIANKYKNKKPVLLYRTSSKLDSSAYTYLGFSDGEVKKLSCNTFPTREKMTKVLDSTTTNLLVVPIMSATYAENLLLQLNDWFPTYVFDVFGMPSWRTMPSLKKPEAFPNIAVHITAPFYFDFSTGPGHALAINHKEDVGSSKPGDMVFRGYETLYWYAYLLEKYGTVFNTKFSDNAAAPFTRFEIKAKRDKDDKIIYQENTHIYLYRYQSSSFMVEQ